MLINGTTVTVKVAHVRLCHSRMLFVRAYPRETQEMVFDAHNRAFAFFKGTCTRGIYDNMKTAVETVFIGKDRQYNRRFLRMCGHYLVEPVACTPAVGLGEGPGREPGRSGARALLYAAAAGGELRGAERLAARPLRRLRQGAQASRAGRPDDLAGVRGGAPAAGADHVARSTASTRPKPRSRRPAWCGSTTTSTRSPRAPSAGRSRSRLMPIAS